MLQDGERETHGVEPAIHTSTMGWKTCGESPPHEANDPLATADADDRPHEVLLPCGSTKMSSNITHHNSEHSTFQKCTQLIALDSQCPPALIPHPI